MEERLIRDDVEAMVRFFSVFLEKEQWDFISLIFWEKKTVEKAAEELGIEDAAAFLEEILSSLREELRKRGVKSMADCYEE